MTEQEEKRLSYLLKPRMFFLWIPMVIAFLGVYIDCEGLVTVGAFAFMAGLIIAYKLERRERKGSKKDIKLPRRVK